MKQRIPEGEIPLFITVEEAAGLLRRSDRTILRMIASGSFRGAFKAGVAWNIPTDTFPGIEAWRAKIAAEKAEKKAARKNARAAKAAAKKAASAKA